jgi:integrase
MALESGRNIKWVAEILGHSDPTITLRTYAHAMHKDNDDLGFLANNRGESVYRLRTASNRLRNLNEARK